MTKNNKDDNYKYDGPYGTNPEKCKKAIKNRLKLRNEENCNLKRKIALDEIGLIPIDKTKKNNFKKRTNQLNEETDELTEREKSNENL